jgi:hypothetical protein
MTKIYGYTLEPDSKYDSIYFIHQVLFLFFIKICLKMQNDIHLLVKI